ncbi:MAG: HlyD family efflux transporter periplasmic adaptor subunit [Cytophagales bacterium]|nr:HlyD family efflux transporter periplasmic adaptor subunit [Cytophagales bacterium]
MDKKLVKKTWTLKRIATIGGIALLVGFVGYRIFFADNRSTLIVEKDKITISEIRMGQFKEYIPQTGEVQPSRVVYLDAIEGGNIKSIARESGAMLKKGDEILRLTNLNRELSVLQQEASFNESINRARETRISILRNDMDQRQLLAAIDNQLNILTPQYHRQKQLFEKKLIAKQEFERTEADYKFNVERKRIAYELYRNDSVDRIRQLRETSLSEQRMSKSLDGVSQILDNLVIRAPIDGQLSSTSHWEIGQNIATGQRLGQVDIVGSYKVRVPIDELYLPRISTGLQATTDFAGKTYTLEIVYVYPNITAGRFEVDMNFQGDTPQGLRRGQSLRLRIELGQPSEELLLPMGGFYKDTGGNWVFILESPEKAVKRIVRLGRKMGSEYFEVLEGLKPGDRVITSSYENFGPNEVLILK